MIDSVSSQAGVYLSQTQASKAPAAPIASSKGEDSVQPAQAKTAISGSGDVDHDGDSH